MKILIIFICLLLTSGCYKDPDFYKRKQKIEKASDDTFATSSIDSLEEEYTYKSYKDVPPPPPLKEVNKVYIKNEKEETQSTKSNKGQKKTDIKKVVATKKYDLGNVVYNIPDTMVVLNSYIIKVRINKITNIMNIKGNLGPGRIVDTVIKISDKMEVTIKDESTGTDKYFEISKINNDQQLIESDDYTEWIFNVKPLKFGNKKLNIVISIVKDGSKKEIVYTDSIYIKMNVKNEVISFWGKYWQWSFTTFIIPIFIYFWKRKNKKGDN